MVLLFLLETQTASLSSSSLDQMVPVLTGINYQDWATRMVAYLHSKNLWGYALGNIQKPVIPPPPASTDVIAAAVAACNQWAAKTRQVMGTIVLKCAPSVSTLPSPMYPSGLRGQSKDSPRKVLGKSDRSKESLTSPKTVRGQS